jgi:hypothetical protein
LLSKLALKDAACLLRCIAVEIVRSLVKAGNYGLRRRHKFPRISILPAGSGVIGLQQH